MVKAALSLAISVSPETNYEFGILRKKVGVVEVSKRNIGKNIARSERSSHTPGGSHQRL